MSITNTSAIAAELVMDLRYDEEADGDKEDKEGLDCLDVDCNESADESILHLIVDEEDELNDRAFPIGGGILVEEKASLPNTGRNSNGKDKNSQKELEIAENQQNSEDESEDLGNDDIHRDKKNKYYSLIVLPGKTLSFTLKFSPKAFKYIS